MSIQQYMHSSPQTLNAETNALHVERADSK